jgi:transcriptional regulator NrdR family protein
MSQENPKAVQDQRGLRCGNCGGSRFRVVYTRAAWGGKLVRRRECRGCGQRMTTWERAMSVGSSKVVD